MKIQRLGIMCKNCSVWPRIAVHKDMLTYCLPDPPKTSVSSYRIVQILSDIVCALASWTELLYVYQIRNVHYSCIGVPGILLRFKIIEYVQYFVAGWKDVLQWLHITEMSYPSVRFTRLAISLATFVLTVIYVGSAVPSAFSLALSNGHLVSVFPLVVIETRMAPKVSVTVRARDSNPRG